jgi:ABC-type transport system involved in cytochrome bd biosynthesis fused ATPase/permease subunit
MHKGHVCSRGANGAIMRNVPSLCNDRGLLVITHDTTTLEDFDRILSL